jgi:hypothetical protein
MGSGALCLVSFFASISFALSGVTKTSYRKRGKIQISPEKTGRVCVYRITFLVGFGIATFLNVLPLDLKCSTI